MKPIKAKVWANPETNESHFGRDFVGEITQDFTKSDLKDGMVVKVKTGSLYLVIGDKLLSKSGFNLLSFYNEELLVCDYRDFDITVVYNCDEPTSISDLFDENKLTKIWERKPSEVQKIEQQMRELAEKQEELADQLAKLNNSY